MAAKFSGNLKTNHKETFEFVARNKLNVLVLQLTIATLSYEGSFDLSIYKQSKQESQEIFNHCLHTFPMITSFLPIFQTLGVSYISIPPMLSLKTRV